MKKIKIASGKIRLIAGKVVCLLRKTGKTLKPSRVAWRSASIGITIVVLIQVITLAILYVGKLGFLVSGLLVFYNLLIGSAAAFGVFLLLRLLKLIPDIYKWIMAGTVAILLSYWPTTTQGKLIILVVTLLSASFMAGSAGVFIIRGWKKKKRVRNILNIIFLTIGLAGLILGSYWLLNSGEKMDIPENAALKQEYRPARINLPDPSEEGDFEILQLFYGSGKDLRRTEFGDKVNIRTDAVDGSRFISSWDKFNGWARTRYWGFDQEALPLNARVWYPGGKGPFPLVLIVHGNHLDRDYSDPGYEYLGRLMASRGYIFASVDENFLNGTWSDIFQSLIEENDCRAWILLKHLELWHKWNADSASLFYQKVDTEQIALIGHSRGGEAVAIAAAFNQLPYYPDDATVKFNFGFNIRSVIAIAPVDGQYKPAKTGTFFHNVNYFVLQGSHDMDMQSYHGSRQFQRIRFTDDDFHVKAGLYIWEANHGQFNTIWGRNDFGYPGIALYNKKQLMPEEDQKKIGKVYISAFLEATLHKKTGYLDLFRDYRTGLDWLPETIYLNLYEDSNCKWISSFEEDINLETATLPIADISTSNLTVWKERMVPLKWGEQDTRAVYLGWNIKETDSLAGNYIITFKEGNESLTDTSGWLVLSLADARESSNPYPKDKENENDSTKSDSSVEGNIKVKINSAGLPDNQETESKEKNRREDKKRKDKAGDEKKSADEKKKKDEEKKDSLDFTIVLTDFNDHSVSLPLSHYAYLQPQLEATIMKADFLTKTAKSEIVFQTFFFPISDFRKVNPGFNPAELKEIRFVFDRTEDGVVVVDNIGFWRKEIIPD